MLWGTLIILNLGWGISSASLEISPAVKDFVIPARTSPPFTYCIGYIENPEEESFLKELTKNPPDLYHLGYQIPFKGALGPTYGHELFTDQILPPNEIPREIERIQRVITKMRTAGVQSLIPYVYTMAFFGNPDKRTGFFHFYDQWDNYRSYGLGPKPEADPSLWVQVTGPQPLGGGPPDVLHYEPCVNHPAWSEYLDLVVRQLASVGYDGMFFDVNTQYCYCPYCQEKFDIYLLKKYGRSGLQEKFGTNDPRELNLSTIYRDYEKFILENFKAYLRKSDDSELIRDWLNGRDLNQFSLDEDWRLLRCFMQGSLGEYPPAGDLKAFLKERFNAEHVDEIPTSQKNRFVQTLLRYTFREYLQSQELAELLKTRFGSTDIRRRCCGSPRDLLLWVETQRFWCNSMASTFARLKQVGQTIFAEKNRKENFFTVANLGSMQTMDGLNKRRVDGIDLAHFAPVADMQMFEEMPQSGSLESGVIISNIFAFRWAMGAGTKAGTLLYKAVDDTAADLAQAEVAAGGGGAFIQTGLSAPDSRKRWKQFFSDHADLWEDGNSDARVGVLFWSDQVFYEYPEHLAMVRRLVHILSECQIPFDIITEEGISKMARYNVVLVPRLRFLEDSQINTLFSYTKQGGKLVVIEPFGTEDQCAKIRDANPLAQLLTKRKHWDLISYGRGKILKLQPEEVPPRQSDMWCLMEERGGSSVLANDFLNSARERDLKDQVDLGPTFINRLEKSLHTRLRWCPLNTDAGVYIHPYSIPAKVDRLEKEIIHVVNYRVPILLEKLPQDNEDPIWQATTKAGEPIPQKDIRITIPGIPKKKIHKIEAVSPTDTVESIQTVRKGNSLTITIPKLKRYQAVVIELEK